MKFSSFNLSLDILDAIEKTGFESPTTVQSKVIPKALKYENLIVQSSTGSGKTHSFLIPIFNNLNTDNGLEVVIVSPTRELSEQTYNFAIQFNKLLSNKYSIKLFISGTDTLKDYDSFKKGANIIICTPGKLNDLYKRFDYLFNQVKTIVFDEADMLFDKSFTDEMSKFLSNFDNVQILLFSATLNKNIQNLFKKYIKESELIEIDSKNFTNLNVKHHLINDKHQDIKHLTKQLINIINPFFLLVFTNTKDEANSLYTYLSKYNIDCCLLTGSLEARERKSILKRINNLEYKVVVCTDIASRGLDIDGASDVLNINLPNNIEYYYHRAGRCGRGKYDGNSYIFYNHEDLLKVNKLIENGLIIDYLKIENDKLINDLPLKVEKKKESKKKKAILDEKTYQNFSKEKAIIIAKNKGSKVKPGYKKKIKKEIQKINKKIHKEELKKEIYNKKG